MNDKEESRKFPSDTEFLFLNYAYNFFLDIQEEISDAKFWEKDSYYRFSRIKDALLVYSEVLEYEPVGWFLEALKKLRPPMEAEMSKDFLLFLRNLVIHFPFFRSWEDVRFTKNLINWSKPGKSIDKFLKDFGGRGEFKCRVWNSQNKKMTYVTIRFPTLQDDGEKEITLKEIVPEKEGIIFSMSLMFRVLESQVDDITGSSQNLA